MADSKEQQQQQQPEEEQEKKPPQSSRSPRRQQAQAPGVQNPRPPRQNKLYRTPPTPDCGAMLRKESTFVLDAVAVSSISDDYSRANPKLGSALPTYNSQRDQHVKGYFQYAGVSGTLQRNRQAAPGTSIEGPIYDRFYVSGHGFRYLTARNVRQPYGYSNEQRMGHGKLWKSPNPDMDKYNSEPREFQGFNGRFGYRRTTPGLRQDPSTFGVLTRTSIY